MVTRKLSCDEMESLSSTFNHRSLAGKLQKIPDYQLIKQPPLTHHIDVKVKVGVRTSNLQHSSIQEYEELVSLSTPHSGKSPMEPRASIELPSIMMHKAFNQG